MFTEHVLVTGGAGFVGIPLVRRLLESGRTVSVYDTFYFGTAPLNDPADRSRLRLIPGDIQRIEPKHLDDIDAIIHLAALSNDASGELRPEWTLAVNKVATTRLAEMAKQQGISKFVFASSCSIYGASGSAVMDETSIVAPVSTYARAKAEAEEDLIRLSDDRFQPIRLRAATVFGVSPRMRFDLPVNVMTLDAVTRGHVRVMGGGEQWRPLIHLKDLVNVYLRCLESDSGLLDGHAFNIVGANHQMKEIGELVQRCVGRTDLEIVPENPDTRSYRVSGERFAEAAGLRPGVSVEEGVAEIVESVRSGIYGDGSDRRYYTVQRLKQVLDVPAIDGGVPVRSKFLPFAQPSIGPLEEQEVLESLRSGWVTTGPKVHRFEQECRNYLGVENAIAVSSCTAALHLSLAALDIGPGDEVITSPITWPTTANVIVHLGAKPVFVDVERDTLNLDATKLEAKITNRTRAIVPVHMAGQACDLDAIGSIADKYGLPVVEDAAHAIGTTYRGRKIGAISRSTCFSFYPTKNVTTIEGGLVTTSDTNLAEKIRVLSQAGISRDAWKRHSSTGSPHWQLIYPGYKYNMTDVQAGVGLHQLPKLEQFIEQREAYVQCYKERLAGTPGVTWLADRPWGRHARHLFEILIEPNELSIDRDGFLAALKAENIGTGIHFVSLHLQPYYRQGFHYTQASFPNAAWASKRIISLPLSPKMKMTDVEDVAAAVIKVAMHFRRTEKRRGGALAAVLHVGQPDGRELGKVHAPGPLQGGRGLVEQVLRTTPR